MNNKVSKKINSPTTNVSAFLDDLNHPLRKVIDQLRMVITNSVPELEENIKWNGPNFVYGGDDRITMRIHPPTQVQLVFHRGAAKQEEPSSHLFEDSSGLLDWRSNDRAVASFRSEMDVSKRKSALTRIVKAWIEATT